MIVALSAFKKGENTMKNKEDVEKETIEKIKESTSREYKSLTSSKTTIINIILTAGIMIFLALIVTTLVKINNVKVDKMENNQSTINVQLDKNGRVISTQELK